MKYKLGKFGEFVKEYEKARRGYPRKIFSFLKNYIFHKKPSILDLGCGTGISTRQLSKIGEVIGCDPDTQMLQAAKTHQKINKEKYVVGSTHNLPFDNTTFDIVTAFSAFHWFNDRKSIAEIKRVLKPGGIIFVVNKTGVKSWGNGYRKNIINTIGQEIARFREDSYNPKKDLQMNGFKKIKIKEWKLSEFFTLKNALEYVQSVSIWSSVPIHQRLRAKEGLKRYFQKMLKEKGKIERKIVVKVVVGLK
ncbi:MAG TPA: class I SAM-dependent methyltransferase [bacterium]|nr:class I SAM-dependent methyltransferase [bacterium]